MKSDQSTTLYPKRLSAVTHGRFVADEHGMYFRFDTSLNPQSVYGVMLRLAQASWLDKHDAIICDDEDSVWEIRRSFPKVAARVRSFYNYSPDDDVPEDMADQRVLFVEYKRARQLHPWDSAWLDDSLCVSLDDLAPVMTVTSNYRKEDDG